MTRSNRQLFIPLLLCVAAPVFADETDTGAPPPEAPRYPRQVIARPLTFPQGVLAVGADSIGNSDLSEVTGSPIIGYGITDKLEVQVPYAFATHDFEARGSLGVDAGYAIIRGALDGKLEAIARVRGGYNVKDSAAAPLMIGVHVQYNILPWLAVISGAPGTQQIKISLADNEDTMKPADVSLPLGIGVQPLDTVYFQLDTKLVQLNLHDSVNAVFGKDATPLTLTCVWNVLPPLDVQGAIGTDLNDAGDALTFLLGARFYAGI